MEESLEEFRNKRIAEGDQYQKNMNKFIEQMIEYGKKNFPERWAKPLDPEFAQIVVLVNQNGWSFVDGFAEESCITDFLDYHCEYSIESKVDYPEEDGMYRMFCTVEYDQNIGTPWDMCEPDTYLMIHYFEKIGETLIEK